MFLTEQENNKFKLEVMINAKEEFLIVIRDKSVRCAKIMKDEIDKEIILRVGYSSDDFSKFLSDLDFEYDDGYGAQELYGTIWFEDGMWAERCEYDGSEWWELRTLPKIPKELMS